MNNPVIWDTYKETADAVASLFMNIEINDYAMENVTLGRIVPGERIPLQAYLHELGYDACAVPAGKRRLSGNVLDERDIIRDKDIDEYYRRHFFNYQMSCVFEDAPKERFDFGDDAMFLFERETRQYIDGSFALFREIAGWGVSYDAYDLLVPYSREQIRQSSIAAAKFLAAVRLKHLRQGMCVHRYFARAEYVSPFVRRLLREKKGRYYLENADTESREYKLALFSVFAYKGMENFALFDLKARRWAADCA